MKKPPEFLGGQIETINLVDLDIIKLRAELGNATLKLQPQSCWELVDPGQSYLLLFHFLWLLC